MLFKKKRIYLDYASATPVSREATREMKKIEEIYGNPGALHAEGVRAKTQLSMSRALVARALSCTASEIIFTSGGTESNNLAILGVAQHILRTGQDITQTHWIVGSIEHDSILSTMGEVERLGGIVTYLEPNNEGIYETEALTQVLRPQTVFVSLGWANSEIGVVQPLSKLSRAIRTHEVAHGSRVLLHTDAGQATLYEKTTVHTLGVDLLSLDSGKLYGPRGIGALYVKRGVELSSILFGGKQERGLRPGTENVVLATGCAAALIKVARTRATEHARLEKMRAELFTVLQHHIPTLILNTPLEHSLPHMLNISIPSIDTEYFVLSLDSAGIAVSTKSACREGEEAQSHVVYALGPTGGYTAEVRSAHTIRLSLGQETTMKDIVRAGKEIVHIYARIRSMV